MASGTIISQVRTSDAYLPIENATVAYYQTDGEGRKRLVGLRKTDPSGKTAPIELDTPGFSASQQPEETGDPNPYRTVDVVADHPDYNRVRILGVQVFDGVVTYQFPEHEKSRSQDLEPIYHDCGQFYFGKAERLLKAGSLVSGVCSGYLLPEELVQDIDNESDWKMAEVKYRLLRGEA